MNSEPSGKLEHADRSANLDTDLNVVGDRPTSEDVPSFGCIVYVSPNAGGGVRVRVANLAGLECTAGSEREAISKIVPAFKQRVAELIASESSIPWIDPPSPAEPGEQERFIPVHL